MCASKVAAEPSHRVGGRPTGPIWVDRAGGGGRQATGEGVFDLVHDLNRVNRAFEADLKPCLAGLQPDERPAVKYILGA
jgi:hypothetical protein